MMLHGRGILFPLQLRIMDLLREMRAAETHQTLSRPVEAALREHLSRRRDTVATKPLDFPIVGGSGLAPGVDLTSNAALSDYVDRADEVYERFGQRLRHGA